jgi:hypothetical protein
VVLRRLSLRPPAPHWNDVDPGDGVARLSTSSLLDSVAGGPVRPRRPRQPAPESLPKTSFEKAGAAGASAPPDPVGMSSPRSKSVVLYRPFQAPDAHVPGRAPRRRTSMATGRSVSSCEAETWQTGTTFPRACRRRPFDSSPVGRKGLAGMSRSVVGFAGRLRG